MGLLKTLVQASGQSVFSEVVIWAAIISTSVEDGSCSRSMRGWYHSGDRGDVRKITMRMGLIALEAVTLLLTTGNQRNPGGLKHTSHCA